MYVTLANFGGSVVNTLPVYNNDPVTYCVGDNASQRFNHGSNASIYGQNSRPCQIYMAQRCADKWDGICEYASGPHANNEYAIRADALGAGNSQVSGLTPGEILIRNTALAKYRTKMHNCTLRAEPFDPINPTSPWIKSWVGRYCVPEFEVDPSTIDSDPVMHKILDKPQIAMQMLLNIRNTMKRKNTLGLLKGTRLGNFYGIAKN